MASEPPSASADAGLPPSPTTCSSSSAGPPADSTSVSPDGGYAAASEEASFAALPGSTAGESGPQEAGTELHARAAASGEARPAPAAEAAGSEARAAGGFAWRGSELPKVQAEAAQPVRIFCGVWNLHGKQVSASDLRTWVPLEPLHHIYAVGSCESGKGRFVQQVKEHLGEDYFMVGSNTLSAIHIMVFLHRYLWRYCWDIKTGHVATGFGNVMGNKGGVQVGFSLGRTSVLFINAHLAAHANKMEERSRNFTRILRDSPLKKEKGSPGVHEEYDRVFFMGDLNPRVAATRRNVDAWIAAAEFDRCLECDQLLPLLHASPGSAASDGAFGLWPLFTEAAITFPPTYKFDSNSDSYDTSKKQRVPSWTDRILWKRDDAIRAMAYDSVSSLKCSDHRPIFGQYEFSAELDNWEGPAHAEIGSKSSAVCSVQ